MTKDQWIQTAKAMLVDCTFCIDSRHLIQEINDLIQQGGGYDVQTESSESELRWPEPSGPSDIADSVIPWSSEARIDGHWVHCNLTPDEHSDNDCMFVERTDSK